MEEGDKSRDLYVVADGSVEFLAPLRKIGDKPVVLCVKGRHEYFGACRCDGGNAVTALTARASLRARICRAPHAVW